VTAAAPAAAPHPETRPAAGTGAARSVPGTAIVEWRAPVGGVEVVFGRGAIDGLGELARELGGRRALVVSDPGVRAAGHAERAVAALAAAGIAAQLFDAVGENPTTREVAAGSEAAKRWGADLLVGVGGGSAMDCAKGINFLVTGGGRMEDYRGFGRAARPLLPGIGVPTTAGTGSEAQSYALITQAETHQKMACGDRQARFRTVVLDPTLVATVPHRTAAAAGLDAIAHAVESLVCRRANPVSRLLSRAAWQLLEPHLEPYLAAPAGGEAAGAVLLGAHLAGAAIEASMLGAAHACANPLTARHGLTHGVAVALMLPAVVRWNAAAAPRYAELAPCSSAAEVAARIEALRAAAGLPASLPEAGVVAADLEALAREAAEQWTAGFNPRPVDARDLLHLYQRVA
jgi:alcohol dehydrogenase